MPLPNQTDRFVVDRFTLRDRSGLLDRIVFPRTFDAQWVCDALNLRDRAEAAVKRYETKALAD